MPGLGASMIFLAVAVAIIAIIVGSVWEVTDLQRTENYDTPDKIYNAPYDVKYLRGPAETGWRLTLLTRLIISTPLGDLMTRHFMDITGIKALIELAEALQKDDGPYSGREFGMSEPLVRLPSAEHAWHVQAASETAKDGGAEKFVDSSKERKYRSLRDFHNAYKSGARTPSQVVERLVGFILEAGSALRCVQDLDRAGAVQAAAESTARWANGTQRGIWDGVPVMLKPMEAAKGLRTTVGRQVRSDGSDIAQSDGIISARLRAAGAIIVGSTVMNEMGAQATGYNPWYHGPVNPFALDRFSGGSSGGSAVAVSAGMVPVATGWDGGGSIRIPASWTGTVGFAPGFARIPYDAASNLAEVTKAGSLSGSVEDAAEAYMLLAQPLTEAEGRARYPWHVQYGGDGPPPPHLKPRWEAQGRRVRVGVFGEWVSHRPAGSGAGTTASDDAVHKAFVRALSALEAGPLKAEQVPFHIPQMEKQALAHVFLIGSMFSFRLISEAFQGSSSFESPETEDDLQLSTYIQLRVGQKITAMELLAVRRIRAFALAQWRRVLGFSADVILTPSTPMTAITRPEGSDVLGFSDSGLMVQMMRFMWPGNLVGIPGIAVPAGVDSAGLPVSVQVFCLHWHEADCLAVARELELAFAAERTTPPPPFFVDLLASDP